MEVAKVLLWKGPSMSSALHTDIYPTITYH